MRNSLTIEKAALVRAMGQVARVVERRNTIPVLSNTLIRLYPGAVELTATDLDIEARVRVETEGTSGLGAITVPAAMLSDIARKVPDGAQVSLAWEDNATKVEVRAGRSRFTLQALPASDYPDIADGEYPHAFALAAADLQAMIEATSFAISAEETRYYLNGIFLHAPAPEPGEEARLIAVATDGHRLARYAIALPEGAAAMPGIIIPRKTVAELAALAKTKPGNIRVEVSTAKIRVTAGDITLTSKLIDGTFPDYTRVIPRTNDKEAVLAREALVQAAERVATVSTERGRAIRLNLEGDRLLLSAINPDTGEAEEEVDISYSGPDMLIGFNARYLLDALGTLAATSVTLSLSDGGGPAVLTSPEAVRQLIVLMPMRV